MRQGDPWTPRRRPAIEAGAGVGLPWRRRALALYHLHLKNISRADGTPERPRSAVACAAYRAGETLWNEAEERDSKFGGRRDVVFTEIRLPTGAPAWMADRSALWNAVEAAEKRRDARLAKEVEFALPRELPRADWVAVARNMADAYASRGFAVDVAIHDDGTQHNPHIHMMMTTRVITPAGFGGKLREADGKGFLKDLRTTWQQVANAALALAGVASTIDARSHAARGIDREPGEHQGPDPQARRERRERIDDMTFTSRLHAEGSRELAAEYAAEEGIRERFPLLGVREDWPPQKRPAPGVALSPERLEEERFWAEVEQYGQDKELREEQASRPEPLVLDREVDEALERVRVAHGRAGEERSIALEAVRGVYRDIRDKLTREMVRAGLMSPRTADQLRELENSLYKDEFERLRAEAQRIEAKRQEVGHWPELTREQRQRVAEREQREDMAKFDEYDRLRRGEDQEPDPDGRPITRDAFHHAQDAMVREMETPDRISAPDPEHAADEKRDARAAADRAAALPVQDRDADSYRLAPQERTMSWLESRQQGRAERSEETPARPASAPGRAMDWLRQRAGARDHQREQERDEREPDRDKSR